MCIKEMIQCARASIKELSQSIRDNRKELIKLTITLLAQLSALGSMVLYYTYISKPDAWVITLLVVLSLFSGVFVFLSHLILAKCSLFHSKEIARFMIMFSPVIIGISIALFIYDTYIALSISRQSTLIYVLLLVLMATWFSFAISLPENEADVVGGSLTIAVVGILATTIGGTLLALKPQLGIAGPLVGSGLTLIAVGLQNYYAERRDRRFRGNYASAAS